MAVSPTLRLKVDPIVDGAFCRKAGLDSSRSPPRSWRARRPWRSGDSGRSSPASITIRQSFRATSASVSTPLAKLRERPDPDGAAAAEQRHRHRLIDQPRRVGREFVAVQPDQ